MRIKNVMLFSYDFPHKKTQDFILRLLVEGYRIQYVLAAPRKKLNIPQTSLNINPVYYDLIEPKAICRRFNIQYFTVDHNSEQAIRILQENNVDLYIISGARILSESVITASHNRILNIHPGLLPAVRGLDTIQWSIKNNIQIGLTAHFISSKIDSGFLVSKKPIKIDINDNLIDLARKLLEKQPNILINAIDVLIKQKYELINLGPNKSKYNSKMSLFDEKVVAKIYESWKEKMIRLQKTQREYV